MRILFYTDPHWSQYSSILRSRSEYHSTRLDNLIYSVNWAEEQAAYYQCSAIIIGGDFFDSNHLVAEEISALQHIRWAPTSHVFITGNHETNMSNLEYSTADLFNLCPDAQVISNPCQYMVAGTDCEFCFLPYILERDRKKLADYFGCPTSKRIIFSHNDLKDVNYGNFISPEGFEVEDIHANCNLFINGHIHHYNKITDVIINGGNLTGQNFTENENYQHGVLIIDTDDLSTLFVPNPYAIHFRKLDFTRIHNEDLFMEKINSINVPSVVTIKVNEDFAATARLLLKSYIRPNLVEYRIIVERSTDSVYNIENKINKVDHLEQFRDYVLTKIGNSQLIQDELAAILR